MLRRELRESLILFPAGIFAAILLIAWIWTCIIGGCSIPVATREAENHSTASGDATHTETDTDVQAGGDASVSNWTFNGGGWAVGGVALLGWFASHRGNRRRDGSLDAVIGAIEENQCADCKACVARRRNATVNARVRKLTKGQVCRNGAKKLIYVYIAAPYTHPDPVVNVRAAIDAAEKLWAAGMVPFIPHLSMFVHFLHPQPWKTWIERDLPWIEICDVLLRLPGDSEGADLEVREASRLGKPIWYDIDALIAAYARDKKNGATT